MQHLQTSGVTLSDSLTWDPQTGYRKTDKCRWYDEEPALKTSKCEMVRQRQKHRCLIVRLVTAVFKQIRQHLVKRLSWVKNWSDTLECKIYWRFIKGHQTYKHRYLSIIAIWSQHIHHKICLCRDQQYTYWSSKYSMYTNLLDPTTEIHIILGLSCSVFR